MCCRPKASFLIDDILQPTKPAAPWPARPTPVYLNSTPHQSLPAPQLYVENAREGRLCVPVPTSYSHSHLADPYKGFGRCWTVLPGYSLSLLARHGHNKRKGGQVRFTAEQTATLEKRFGGHKYLSPEERRHLAGQLKLTDRQVKTWFQNRRAKWRRASQATSTDSSETAPTQSEDTSTSNIHDEENVFSPQGSPISVTS
ncbi:hematopoietically-expressed homeobox protein HHEX homolog isoform X2 [Anabrus simplex]|uniref:hematopoietically-expressed homeobox protein HHEX homolog isoform X2 n=1 Tax=Anabrus simplex TaxID=316456 RepID=UPI0035A2BDA6